MTVNVFFFPSSDVAVTVAFFLGLRPSAMPATVERLAAREAEGAHVLARLELQREDAHAREVRAVDALEALRDDGLDAEEHRALRSPVA